MWEERQNFPLIAQLHLRESLSRSVPAPTTFRSRSAHAPLGFMNPAHRSAPLIWLFDQLRSTARPDLRGGGQSLTYPHHALEDFTLHPLIFFVISRSYRYMRDS